MASAGGPSPQPAVLWPAVALQQYFYFYFLVLTSVLHELTTDPELVGDLISSTPWM